MLLVPAAHFVDKLSDTEQLQQKWRLFLWKYCFITIRLVHAKTFWRRRRYRIWTPTVEFYYKNDDFMDDPLYQWRAWNCKIADDQQIAYLKEETASYQWSCKPGCWIGLKLIDFKLEFEFDKDGKIILADNFSWITADFGTADGNHMDKDVFSVRV